jgi:WD40 repeat protein
MFSIFDGCLLAAFSGHDKEINVIDINFENTLLASADISLDNSIRIWDIRTGQNIKILNGNYSRNKLIKVNIVDDVNLALLKFIFNLN